MVRLKNSEIDRRKKIGNKISVVQNLRYDIKSILDISARTSQKILKRMWDDDKIQCSNCGWNQTTCDLHHINGRKIIDANSHDNLCYLCPNCHRLAHRGIITKLVTFREQIGDEWQNYFYGFRPRIDENELIKRISIKYDKKEEIDNLKLNRKLIVLNSDINYNKFGWGVKLSKLINISPQKSKIWVKNNMPEFYNENCYKHNNK